jgi:putative peptidoglycan lipid II flippase
MLMLNRAFFSLQENWVPTAVALANLFVNGLLDVAFSPLGIWGIPLATSVVNLAGTLALVLLLRRRLERLELTDVGRSFARVVVASTLSGAIAFAVWWPLDHALGRSFGGQVVSLLPALVAAVAAYLAACRALGVREMQALLSLRSRARRG